jgi:hypothetical protein
MFVVLPSSTDFPSHWLLNPNHLAEARVSKDIVFGRIVLKQAFNVRYYAYPAAWRPNGRPDWEQSLAYGPMEVTKCVLSCPALPCPAVSCCVLLCPVLPCIVLPCLALYKAVLPCPI